VIIDIWDKKCPAKTIITENNSPVTSVTKKAPGFYLYRFLLYGKIYVVSLMLKKGKEK